MWAICCSISKSPVDPQTLDDEVGLDRRGGLHDEPGERDDRDPVAFRQARLGELDPVVEREQPRRLLGVVHARRRRPAEQLQRLVDDVDVTEVERIETAGYQDRRHGCAKRYFGHRSKKVTQVRP